MAPIDPATPYRRCRSRVEGVVIAEAALRTEHLTPQEATDLAGRAPQSLAAVVAAKTALCGLFADLGSPRSRPADFVLTHDPDGAPAVRRHPPLPPGYGAVYISITHTRTRAYALVAVQEVGGAPHLP